MTMMVIVEQIVMNGEVSDSILPDENSSLERHVSAHHEPWRTIAYRSLSSTNAHGGHKHLNKVETVKRRISSQ